MKSDQLLEQVLFDYQSLLSKSPASAPSLRAYCQARHIRYKHFCTWLHTKDIDPDSLNISQSATASSIRPIDFTPDAIPKFAPSAVDNQAASLIRKLKFSFPGKITLSIGEIAPDSLLYILRSLTDNSSPASCLP